MGGDCDDRHRLGRSARLHRVLSYDVMQAVLNSEFTDAVTGLIKA